MLTRNSSPVPFWFSLLAVALVSLIASISNAAEAVLKAPATFAAGQLVTLEAGGTKADTVEWICSDSDVRCWYSADKRSCVVCVPSARKCVFVVKASDKSGHDVAYSVCDVTGEPGPNPAPAPGPQPDPSPTPQPAKPLPAGRFGISQGVRDQALKIVQVGRPMQGTMVAESLKTVRSQIVAGGVDASKPSEVLTALRQANAKLPVDVRRAWSPWGLWWGEQVKTLHGAGKLKSADDWRDLLDETCLGLDGI